MTYDTTFELRSERQQLQKRLQDLAYGFATGDLTMDALQHASTPLRQRLSDVERLIMDATGNENPDLSISDARIEYAHELIRRGPMQPTADHLVLLQRAFWSWDEAEFGAPAMNAKRPYGNSDVDDDLAELLPHLSPEDRLRVHCELAAVIPWIIMEYVAGARTANNEAGERA